LHRYSDDVDACVSRAIGAGATLLRPVVDGFYGDRTGQLADPCGYRWMVATRRESVSPKEMQARWTRMLEGG